MTEFLLDEESEAPMIDKDTLRSLVIAGGHPHILITIVDPENGGITVDVVGIESDKVTLALREVADLIESGE